MNLLMKLRKDQLAHKKNIHIKRKFKKGKK